MARDRASRGRADRADHVAALGGTAGLLRDVERGAEELAVGGGGPGDLFVLEGPLFLGAGDFDQVVDAGVRLQEVVRALMKFGTAMAASKPIIATTIMISTRGANPDWELFFLRIFLMAVWTCGRRVFNKYDVRPRIACCDRLWQNVAPFVPSRIKNENRLSPARPRYADGAPPQGLP